MRVVGKEGGREGGREKGKAYLKFRNIFRDQVIKTNQAIIDTQQSGSSSNRFGLGEEAEDVVGIIVAGKLLQDDLAVSRGGRKGGREGGREGVRVSLDWEKRRKM